MTRKLCALLFVGCAALGLGGCVAAIIPVAAGGAIGRSKLRHHKPASVRPDQAIPRVATPDPADAPLPSVPPDRGTMEIGQAYRGQLPPPDGRTTSNAPTITPPSSTITNNVLPPVTGSLPSPWSDVMHLAATASLQKPVISALLAKGSTTAMPHWLPCGDKPVAVLVNLPVAGTMFFANAMDNLNAIETMGVSLLFMSDQPAAVVARQRALLAAAHVTVPRAGTTLFTRTTATGAATRATLGTQYCVVAVVGSRATDFPNATLPGAAGASPAWFLIR